MTPARRWVGQKAVLKCKRIVVHSVTALLPKEDSF